MQFSEITSAIADQFGDTSAAMLTRIKRYVNWNQQDVASRDDWDFIFEDSYIQTTAPYTTGTVYASGTTLNGVGTTFTAAMVGRKVRIGGEQDYYTISAYVSGTELTLSQTYRGTYDTVGEAISYTIYQDVYSLGSTVEKIINMVQTGSNQRIGHISRTQFTMINPNPTSTGTPYLWTEAGRDSVGNIQIQLSNIPDSNYIIYYLFRKRLTDLSADTDVSLIPVKYHRVLYLGGMAQCYDYDQDPQGASYRAEYENMIEQMRIDLMSGSEDTYNPMGVYGSSVPDKSLRLPPAHFEN